jgi:hypothetical protein
MGMMLENETSISYQDAKEKGIVQLVKNAWKNDVSKRRVSRDILATQLRDWRKGKNELIVDHSIISKG